MNKKPPVIADGTFVDDPSITNPSQFPRIGPLPFADILGRGKAREAMDLAMDAYNLAASAKLRARWGRIFGEIEAQEDLQEEFAVSEHSLCGGI